MALRPCKECKKEISTDAKVCPHCGKRAGGSRGWLWLFVAIFILAIVGYINQLPDNGPAANLTGSSAADTESTQPQNVWAYSSEADRMGRGATEYASLESVNEVNFEFPYNGGSKGILLLRNSPEYGRDAILEVTKGQFLCDTDGCSVSVRVDNGALRHVEGNESADGSSNLIFLPYATILRDLRSAKVLRIEANFYQEGSRVLEFHPQGLDVRKLASKK